MVSDESAAAANAKPADTQRVGEPDRLSEQVRRVLAPNASSYTYTGTQTYLVGTRELAVIDPGPDDAAHVAALLAAIGDVPVTAILCTHNHRDHSPAARALKAATGAPIIGCAALTPAIEGGFDASFDAEHRPDRVLADGERVAGVGWTLETVATPGHTSNHLAFALAEEAALFSGDHVMGWSTSVVIPPDGDMGAYLASLERLLARDEQVYLPGHGEPIAEPGRLVRGMIGHRRHREGQILRLLREGEAAVPPLVARMYRGLDARLLGAAAASVHAHLIDLAARRLVERAGDAWRIAA